jgi:uncharacterized protein (TIGR02145 family)
MAAGAIALILSACGGETTENITNINQMGMDVVSSVGDLPKCSADNEGEQAFVKGETSARICVDGEWFATASNGGEGASVEFSCTTKELKDKSGLKIVCNGDSIGVVLNGSDGKDGADGKGCTIASQTDSTVTVACGTGKFTMALNGGSGVVIDTTGYEVENASISGVSQKGPFVKGAQVTAYELDGSKSLLQTGRTFSGNITQDDGRFNLSNVTLKSSYVRLSANGYYRNEVTGKNSTSPITLNAVTDLSSRNTVNVNLLTHLEYGRVARLMAESDGTLKIKTAKKQAEKEIFEAFHIDATGFGYSEDLDVFGKSDADAALLAISILLQGDRTESELTELLSELSDDLSDGKWDDDAKRAEIAGWVLEKEIYGAIPIYRENVSGWGLSTTVPEFEMYMHNFWVGEKSLDCSTANDGESFVFPLYNGYVVAVFCSHDDVVLSIEGELLDKRDEHRYRTMKIGNQTWMAENLDYEIDSSYCYKDDVTNCSKYGRIYTWNAAKKACPSGWHLPSETEWETLFNAVGGQSTAGNVLKSTSGWSSGNGSDAFGFSALPAGDRDGGGNYGREGHALFWSSTEVFDSEAIYMFLTYNNDDARLSRYHKNIGFSVRCLQD